ncbi:MAG: hypothetical protein H7832_15275 [Magnetococcus sp. DMHC-6]
MYSPCQLGKKKSLSLLACTITLTTSLVSAPPVAADGGIGIVLGGTALAGLLMHSSQPMPSNTKPMPIPTLSTHNGYSEATIIYGGTPTIADKQAVGPAMIYTSVYPYQAMSPMPLSSGRNKERVMLNEELQEETLPVATATLAPSQEEPSTTKTIATHKIKETTLEDKKTSAPTQTQKKLTANNQKVYVQAAPYDALPNTGRPIYDQPKLTFDGTFTR